MKNIELTECFFEKSSFSISLQLLRASESFSLPFANCGVMAEWCDAPAPPTPGDNPPILKLSSTARPACTSHKYINFVQNYSFNNKYLHIYN